MCARKGALHPLVVLKGFRALGMVLLVRSRMLTQVPSTFRPTWHQLYPQT